MSPVHDHVDAHCLMKVLKGDLVERRFAIPQRPGEEGEMKETSRREYGVGKVAYMHDQVGTLCFSGLLPATMDMVNVCLAGFA